MPDIEIEIIEEPSRDYHRHTKEEREQLIDSLLEAKARTRASWDEIGEQHGVSRSTIRRWRETDEWKLAEAKWRRILREEARTDVALIGQDMVGVLQDLAHHARSEFVRYSAAGKLIDIFGIENEIEETRNDQAGELLKFMQLLNGKSVSPVISPEIIEAEVKPGGFLPERVEQENRQMMEDMGIERED